MYNKDVCGNIAPAKSRLNKMISLLAGILFVYFCYLGQLMEFCFLLFLKNVKIKGMYGNIFSPKEKNMMNPYGFQGKIGPQNLTKRGTASPFSQLTRLPLCLVSLGLRLNL